MPDESEMAVPVTRGEMETALAKLANDIIGALRSELGGAVATLRGEIGTAFNMCEEHIGLQIQAQARQTEENVIARVEGVLDPYKGLPQRVSKLEAKVFAPKRRATAARRKRS